MSGISVRLMRPEDVAAAVALQRAAFPPPFSEDLLWQASHLHRHLELFPEGQWIAWVGDQVAGSCSNTLISEERWNAHASWVETVGGPYLEGFDPDGTTLYGLDITVHPDFRRIGVGRAFYRERYGLVQRLGLTRYGTACRLPDFRAYEAANPGATPESYASAVASGEANDRTLTPLLRYGLAYRGIIEDYMEDYESADSAAMLEWRP